MTDSDHRELERLRHDAEILLWQRLVILDQIRQAKELRAKLLEEIRRIRQEMSGIGFAPKKPTESELRTHHSSTASPHL